MGYFSLIRECSPGPSLEEEKRLRGSPRLQKHWAPDREGWAGGAGFPPQKTREQGSEPRPNCDWLCDLGGVSHLLWTFTSSLGKWDLATPRRDRTWVGR